MSGDAFVFVGKAANWVKLPVFARSGLWGLAKLLASGRFGVAGTWRAPGDDGRVELSQAELQLLLEGIEIRDASYRTQYQHPSGAC